MNSQEYLDIELEPSIKRKIRADHVVFWNDLVPNLNNIDCQTDKEEEADPARIRQELWQGNRGENMERKVD